jgi:O-antigen biosynthesis protein WbqP
LNIISYDTNRAAITKLSREKDLGNLMKRILDFIFALVLLIILFPVLMTIYLLVEMTSDGPALFKQLRMGQDNKEFYIYKFRTMKMNTPNIATIDFHDVEQYITKVGKFLRKTSLDELPQLYNILEGTMSFVGPRPLIVDEREVLNMRTLCGVYQLTPGLTGWAQVNGRDNIRNDEKVRLDYEYSLRKCLLFDLKIILLTGIKVFKQADIRKPNNSDVVVEIQKELSDDIVKMKKETSVNIR